MHATVVIVGAGQAGLAMSSQLTARSIDHVVLERGQVAHSWRTERWDSLRLLTPAWMNRLPGRGEVDPDPDAFGSAADTVAMLSRYATTVAAPVHEDVEVTGATAGAAGGEGFVVETAVDRWTCRALVVASGASSEPHVPAVAAGLPPHLHQLCARDYRNPDQLGPGPVLVVGASASGVQIAEELRASGRAVTLAVGEHVRAPRTYRGRDIHWWLDQIGLLDERAAEVDDVERARRTPSFQLVGSDDRHTLDLTTLRAAGVDLVGKLVAVVGPKAQCSGGLAAVTAAADLKLARLLSRIDAHAEASGLAACLPPPERPEPTRTGAIVTEVDLRGFATVIWASGYRPRLTWLDRRAFDARGRLRHEGGVGQLAGLYLMGLPFLRRRKSNFIDGAGPDAAELADHLHRWL